MASDLFVFGPFELDATARQLTNAGVPIPLPPRQFDLLLLLAAHAGEVLSKDALVNAAWQGLAVTDNSVEQAISGLRRALAVPGGDVRIETQARRGYRLVAEVRRVERRAAEDALDALLAPHRAWIEGRASLETLERSRIVHARGVFETVLTQVPDSASAHVGLANACVMQFEMTRSERAPDREALATAVAHARDACRLDPRYGEAWATLGFVLDRTGHHDDAVAASRMAVSLESDNWRHHLRLAYVSWGEERLREARRTLALLPGFPLAHWLAATVHVARQAFDEAERELRAGLAPGVGESDVQRFGGVALHWLLGLVLLERGDQDGALEQFDLELMQEHRGHLYAHECCANAWYAIGVVRRARGDEAGARAAFAETLSRVPLHPAVLAAGGGVDGQEQGLATVHALLARLRGAAAGQTAGSARTAASPATVPPPQAAELAFLEAVSHVARGDVDAAVQSMDAALQAAPAGSALWTLPVDPILRPSRDARWAPVLARLRNRAA